MSDKSSKLSKRQLLRQQRERKQRQQRITIIAIVAVAALVIAAFLIVPAVIEANTPVGDITEVEPGNWPQEDGAAMGDPNAPVRIDIYEDFQCPACKLFSSQVEPQLVENEIADGTVFYVFHQYPFLDDRLPNNNESDQAANAAECAAEQNRFWDYHKILFANSEEFKGAFTDKRLIAYAEAVGLDMDQFRPCFNQNRYEDAIQEDIQAGNQAGVTGTPGVFVNGQQVKPGFVPSYEDIQAAIQDVLAASGG